MIVCCVSGCEKRYIRSKKLKFYKIPSRGHRRRLWLRAIQEANGSTARLTEDDRVCGAHFISGKLRLELCQHCRHTVRETSGLLIKIVGFSTKLPTYFYFCFYFIGEASMERDKPDFVPSVFTCTKKNQSPKKKVRW